MVKDANFLLEPLYSTQLLGIVRCNLIWLGCEEFGRTFGFAASEEFHCPVNVHPILFAQLCSFYHQSKLLDIPQSEIKVSNSSVKLALQRLVPLKLKKSLIQVQITS